MRCSKCAAAKTGTEPCFQTNFHSFGFSSWSVDGKAAEKSFHFTSQNWFLSWTRRKKTRRQRGHWQDRCKNTPIRPETAAEPGPKGCIGKKSEDRQKRPPQETKQLKPDQGAVPICYRAARSLLGCTAMLTLRTSTGGIHRRDNTKCVSNSEDCLFTWDFALFSSGGGSTLSVTWKGRRKKRKKKQLLSTKLHTER